MYTSVNGLVVIDTTIGQALYGYADLTMKSSGTFDGRPPGLAGVVISGGSTLKNGGCINQCETYPDEHSFQMSASDSNGSFSLLMTTPNSLVDYMGGPLCYIRSECEGDAYTYAAYTVNYPAILFNGVQIPAGTFHDIAFYFRATLTYTGEVVTPEPSSLILLGSGALGMFGIVRRRMLNA